MSGHDEFDESQIDGGPFALPTRVVDQIDQLAYKANGIVAIIGAASDQDLPDQAIPGACLAVCDMLDEIKRLAYTKAEQ